MPEQSFSMLLVLKLVGMHNLAIEILNEMKQEEALALTTNLLELVQRTLATYETPSLDLIPTTPATCDKNLLQELIRTTAEKIEKMLKDKQSFNTKNVREVLTSIEWDFEPANRMISVTEDAPRGAFYSDTLRRATLNDLPDLALICMMGLSHSPVFKLQRPNYSKYPGDTLADFQLQAFDAFLRGAEIIVIYDRYNSLEEKEFPEKLPRRCICRKRTSNRVIVGALVVTGLKRTLSDDDRAYLEHRKECTVSLGRDKDMNAVGLYFDQTKDKKSEYFDGCELTVTTLAVLKPYQRRGHGTSLLNACTKLADSNGARMAGSFTLWSQKIAKRAGFNTKDLVVQYGEESFVISLGVRSAPEV